MRTPPGAGRQPFAIARHLRRRVWTVMCLLMVIVVFTSAQAMRQDPPPPVGPLQPPGSVPSAPGKGSGGTDLAPSPAKPAAVPAVVATPTPDTPLPCEDFGDRLGFRRSALVQVDMRGTTVPGFFAQDEGVTWLVLQVSSGLVGDDANCRICFTPADALRKAPAPIDWAIRAPIPVGTGPLAWLVDATALQPKLAELQVHPIPLVDGTGQWRRHVAGDALLAMWIEPAAPDALIHHAVLRAEALEAVSGRVRLRFTSPLPASAATAPMLDRGGFLIGLVEAPSAGQAITARCIGPDELRGAMQQMPLVWANPEGLQALVAQARSMGFTRLAARHVRQMRSGAWKGLYDAPAAPCQTAFLGYVGEDAGEALRMSATRGFSCSTIFAPPFDPTKSASPPFALPP